MKIVVTGTRGIPNVMGGVETHCEELYPRLAKRGLDVTVIRRKSYVADGLTEWDGVKLIDIDSPKKKAFEAIIHTFRAINKAKRMRADIVHIHSIGPALLTPYAKMRGMRVVFTHHGADYHRDKWGKLAKMALKLGECFGCLFADDVIVISHLIYQWVQQKYGRMRHVYLLYNGVSAPEKCDFPEYFQELGIRKNQYILSICRFVPEKNLHHLIEAFYKVQEGDFKLVLAGDSDMEDCYSRELKRMAQDKGVILTGFVKGRKLHSLLTHCRCYCLPSSHEGLSIALLEAMNYGVKVLVSDIPANKEVGLPLEDYFPVGHVDALAEKLRDVIRKPLVPVEYDMTRYNWDNIACQTMAVYVSRRTFD